MTPTVDIYIVNVVIYIVVPVSSQRLTLSSAAVLHSVAQGHGYGFDVMDVTGLPSGTVYPALRRLERSGLLRARWEDAKAAHKERRPARRYYVVTGAGAESLESALKRFRGLHTIATSRFARSDF